MKSDLIHTVVESSYCKYLKILTHSQMSVLFQTDLTANKCRYIISPFMTTLLALRFTVFGMSVSVFILGVGEGVKSHSTAFVLKCCEDLLIVL